jgi:chemotaxis protein MotB
MKAGLPLLKLFPAPQTASGKAWLVTFTDLVCLLLTFFVMLYSMSEPDPARYQRALGVVSGHGSGGSGAPPPSAAFTAESLNREKAADLGYLRRVFENLLPDNPALADLHMMRRPEGLVLSLPADLLFAPGQATLSESGRAALFVMAGVADNLGNALDVAGHADATPSGSQWPSNWELSLARAQAVAAALHQAGYLRPITMRGHGDGRAGEVAATPDRNALARRVELVIRDHGEAQ